MECDDRKLYVLDTNVLLHEPLAIYSFEEHDVVVPMTVLEELDNIKDRQKDVSREARIAIRTMEDVFREAAPEQIADGVLLSERVGETCTGRLSILPITICRKAKKCSPIRKTTTASSMPPFFCRRSTPSALSCW